jgi:TPR repeat protein
VCRWLRASAESGYGGGIYELGYSYHQSEGVAADSQEALKWFCIAVALRWGGAVLARNFTEKELNAEQIEAASKAANAWFVAHPDIFPQGR